MSVFNILGGAAKWITSWNTSYSRTTSQVTTNPYYYGVYTSWTSTWTTGWWTYWNSVQVGWMGDQYANTTWQTSSSWVVHQNCVQINSKIPSIGEAKDVKVGDIMMLADDKTLEPALGKVTYSKTKSAKGWRILTKNNVSLVCSESAPIPTKDKGLITPANLLGEFVPTYIKGVVEWSEIIETKEVGEIQVQHITVGDKCFWAGENANEFILHHNLKVDGYTYFTSWTYFNTTIATISIPAHNVYTDVPMQAWTSVGTSGGAGGWTSYYTSGAYTTSWGTSWSVVTSTITG